MSVPHFDSLPGWWYISTRGPVLQREAMPAAMAPGRANGLGIRYVAQTQQASAQTQEEGATNPRARLGYVPTRRGETFQKWWMMACVQADIGGLLPTVPCPIQFDSIVIDVSDTIPDIYETLLHHEFVKSPISSNAF